MAHRKKNRNVGIIGIGQTKHSSHREDVNQPEMIHEAVSLALKDAGLTMKDIDCVVHGNMELFEMVHQPDMWHMLGTGAYGKDCIRITTGGTVGGTISIASDNLVASGMYDIVMAIGFEKQQEGHTTGGITNMADPLWFRKIQAGALTGSAAYDVIDTIGLERANRASMTYRIIMDKHAGLNPNSHRAFGLDFSQIDDLVKTSPKTRRRSEAHRDVLPVGRRLLRHLRLREKGEGTFQDPGVDTGPYHRSQGRDLHHIRVQQEISLDEDA